MISNGSAEESLRVPGTAERSYQSILKEINPEYSLEGLMLKLKLQCFGYLVQSADSLGKTLMLGKIEDKRRRRQQRMRWLHGITDSVLTEFEQTQRDVKNKEACCTAVQRIAKVRNNWMIEQQHLYIYIYICIYELCIYFENIYKLWKYSHHFQLTKLNFTYWVGQLISKHLAFKFWAIF